MHYAARVVEGISELREGVLLGERYLLARRLEAFSVGADRVAGVEYEYWVALEEATGAEVWIQFAASGGVYAEGAALAGAVAALRRINHPAVPAVHAFGEYEFEQDGVLRTVGYCAMPALEGETLAAAMVRETLDRAEILLALGQVAEVLQLLGEFELVHGHLSAHSVLLTTTADAGYEVVLADLPASLALETTVESELTAAADVYALAWLTVLALVGSRVLEAEFGAGFAATLEYELLAAQVVEHRRAWAAENLEVLGVSAGLAEVLLLALGEASARPRVTVLAAAIRAAWVEIQQRAVAVESGGAVPQTVAEAAGVAAAVEVAEVAAAVEVLETAEAIEAVEVLETAEAIEAVESAEASGAIPPAGSVRQASAKKPAAKKSAAKKKAVETAAVVGAAGAVGLVAAEGAAAAAGAGTGLVEETVSVQESLSVQESAQSAASSGSAPGSTSASAPGSTAGSTAASAGAVTEVIPVVGGAGRSRTASPSGPVAGGNSGSVTGGSGGSGATHAHRRRPRRGLYAGVGAGAVIIIILVIVFSQGSNKNSATAASTSTVSATATATAGTGSSPAAGAVSSPSTAATASAGAAFASPAASAAGSAGTSTGPAETVTFPATLETYPASPTEAVQQIQQATNRAQGELSPTEQAQLTQIISTLQQEAGSGQSLSTGTAQLWGLLHSGELPASFNAYLEELASYLSGSGGS
jgi:hypothetical protein